MERTRTPNIYRATLKDGRRVYRVMLSYRDPATGQRKQKMKTFPTEHAAKDALAENRASLARGDDAPPSKVVLGDLLSEWLARKEAKVKPTTYRAYRTTIEKHIRPRLGAKRVTALTPRVIELHYTWLREHGTGPVAIRAVHARLRDVLRYARRQRLITTNPFDNVDRPAASEHEHVVWDDQEIARVFAVADQSRYGPIWHVALLTGMRRGELLGLRWEDIDEQAGVIHVRQQVTYYDRLLVGVEPKHGSRRTVSVPPSLITLLRQHRARVAERRLRHGAQWQEHGLVFTARLGGPIPLTSLRLDLNRIITLAGVTPIRVHDVRHTHGSWLMRRGKSPKEVAERLGHKHASLTLDVYAHSVPDEHRQTALDIERWLATG